MPDTATARAIQISVGRHNWHKRTRRSTINANKNRFDDGQGYAYDHNGNLVNDAESRGFSFNGDNKQTKVTHNGNKIAEYFFDGEGKRVKKKVFDEGDPVNPTEETVFVYSNGKLIAEYSTAQPPPNPTTSYTATDQLGSPRVITNTLGAVVSRRDFKPFGEQVAVDGSYRSADLTYNSGDGIRQKFTGYQKDEETQLDFAEARMYENRHARFTAVDPLLASGKSANPQTFNRFVYCLNNPLLLSDPGGLQVGIATGAVYRNGLNYRIYAKGAKIPAGYERVTETKHTTTTINGVLFSFEVRPNGWTVGGRMEGVNIQPAIKAANTLKSSFESEAVRKLSGTVFNSAEAGYTGIPQGVGNLLIDSWNLISRPLGPMGYYLGIPNPYALPKFQARNPLHGDYISAGYWGAAVGTLPAGGVFGEASALRVTPGEFTRSYCGLGQQMHAEFMVDERIPELAIKEFRLPSGKRIDFLDIPNETIYELKPYNPRGIQAGWEQLQMYKTELESMPRFQGIQWKTQLRTY